MCTQLHTIEVQNPRVQGTLSVRATFWACVYLIFSVTSTLLIKRKGIKPRSLLGQVGNSGNIPGVLKQPVTTTVSKDKVSWSNVVCRNLWLLTCDVCISTYIEIMICDEHVPWKDGAKHHVDLHMACWREHMTCWREIVRLEIFLEIKVNQLRFDRLDFDLTFN